MDKLAITPSRPAEHKRSRSAAAIKSFLSPSKNNSISPLKTRPITTCVQERIPTPPQISFLPSDHPHCRQPALTEINNSPTRPFMRSPQKDHTSQDQQGRPLEARRNPSVSPKKPTRLPAHVKDKENATPPTSSHQNSNDTPTPIWAQFASQPLKQHDPAPELSSRRTVQEEIALRAPPQHRPSVPERRTTDFNQQAMGEVKRDNAPKLPSKVSAAVAMFNTKQEEAQAHGLSGNALDEAFEAVLAARNIPENMRQNMRNLDIKIKRDFIKAGSSDQKEPSSPDKSKSFWSSPKKSLRSRSKSRSRRNEDTRSDPREEESPIEDEPKAGSPSKRGRSRSRTFNLHIGDKSPFKRARSNSRPRSLMSLKNLSSSSMNSLFGDGEKDQKDSPTSPDVFVKYLQTEREPPNVEVGRIHKLRILLRSGSIEWTENFIAKGGMSELVNLLQRTMAIEWREEHEDVVMHEVLLCLKGLCTTERAQDELQLLAPSLFPEMLKMLFDEERKGPSEFNTRGIIISLLFMHLASAPASQQAARARQILSYLKDPGQAEDEAPADFIKCMRVPRPYTLWNKEILSVGKEVFWIFLHHFNVISMSNSAMANGETYALRYFPREKPPIPAAPYVGGVEWEATQYLTLHLDLLNGLIASLPSRTERNQLRSELEASGIERTMGETLRTCKEKFYGYVHDALRVWILAGDEDGWQTRDVRMGKSKEDVAPRSPGKRKEEPPKLDLPRLQFQEPVKPGASDESAWL